MRPEEQFKQKTDTVDAEDLLTYQKSQSDFEFEMVVLKSLRSAGFRCDHAGTYRDPVTSKLRQYDIRASMTWDEKRTLWLAVECKLLSRAYPLVISRVPRSA